MKITRKIPMAINMMSHNAGEGIDAFLTKRTPT
jgi:hypothetical protein